MEVDNAAENRGQKTIECEQEINPVLMKSAGGLRTEWEMTVDVVETEYRVDLQVQLIYRRQRELVVRPVTDKEKLFGFEVLVSSPESFSEMIPIIDGDKNEAVNFEAAVKRAFEEQENAEDYETIGGAVGVHR